MLRRQNLCVIACMLLAATSHAWANEQIQWAPNLSAAITQASRQNQLVLIHFWTPDCAPCRALEKNVFNQPEVAQAIHRDFVPVKINAQAMPDTARKYKVDRWPTDVIITPAGYVLQTMVSSQDPREYTQSLVRIAGQRRPGMQLASNATVGTQPVDQSGWGDNTGQQNPSAQAQPQPQSAPGNQAWDANGWNQPAANPPQQGASQPQLQGDGWGNYGLEHTASYGSQYADQNTPPADDPRGYTQPQPQGAVNPYAAPSNSPAGSAPTNNAANNFQPSNLQPAQGNPAANGGAAPQGNSTPANANRPTLGLDGFCPVTMVDQGKWQRGDERFGIIHRGRLYLFASEAEKQRFWADPDRFAPMLSGNDPVEFVEHGRLVPGHRRHGVFYRNQIYLFVSEASLQAFWNNPQRYSDVSQQAMRRVQMR
jgi:protein disulfide-isomerase